ncbi:hypothetical protein Tco_1562736, partial [Tanacetum coccineum]
QRHIDLESDRRDLQLDVRRERYSRSKLLFQNLHILFKVDFDLGFEGLRLSSFARVLGLIKVRFSFVSGFKKSDHLEYKKAGLTHGLWDLSVKLVKKQLDKVSNDDTAMAQRRLEDKQPEEKTNTDCLVKERENVHIGIKVGANITVTGVPGQEGAEGNVAEKKKGLYES